MNITVPEKQAKKRLADFEAMYGKVAARKLQEMTDAFIAELEKKKGKKKGRRC